MPRQTTSRVRRIALIGNSMPRRCGIATFTCDLARALGAEARNTEILVVPINDTDLGYDYPDNVRFEISERNLSSYRQAADFLNLNDVDVVCLQHEFGIFGGTAGRHVLTLLEELRMPVVTTLHTILREPTDDQRQVMEGLNEFSDRLVTMSERGAEFLRTVYGVTDGQIEVIPHGIPDVPFVDPSFYKDKFGVEGRDLVLTFGLIGPGKGIEQVIEAMPGILERHPDMVYFVLGATHPHLQKEQGELYRLGLERRARDLGVAENMVFYNRFVSAEALNEFLGAADVYITPYPHEAQICSGTLAFAVGTGKAVVSTPYWHATELLDDNRGVLVPFDDSAAIARAVNGLLDDPVGRAAMRKRAYLHARYMTWDRVAQSYLNTFRSARDARRLRPRVPASFAVPGARPGELPVLRLDHLRHLTDTTGLIQHATFAVPNYHEGYATDDNARALILVTLLERLLDGRAEGLTALTSSYMGFLQYALNPAVGRFRNFLAYDNRSWLEEVGSEDSHGRALWALGTVAGLSSDADTRSWAKRFFEAGLAATREFTSPRAWAFSLLGVEQYLCQLEGDRVAQDVRANLAEKLMGLYRANAKTGWMWFEPIVSYCNAKLPHALMVAGHALDDSGMKCAALDALEWLCDMQTAREQHFVPIGSNGFYPQDGERARFDQQPVEAHATVSAALAAHRITGDAAWLGEAQRAFDWFIGRNDVGCPVYNPRTGGCHDGLHPDGVNRNQGAESTLAFLLSLAELRLARQEAPPKRVVTEPAPGATAAKPAQTVEPTRPVKRPEAVR